MITDPATDTSTSIIDMTGPLPTMTTLPNGAISDAGAESATDPDPSPADAAPTLSAADSWSVDDVPTATASVEPAPSTIGSDAPAPHVADDDAIITSAEAAPTIRHPHELVLVNRHYDAGRADALLSAKHGDAATHLFVAMLFPVTDGVATPNLTWLRAAWMAAKETAGARYGRTIVRCAVHTFVEGQNPVIQASAYVTALRTLECEGGDVYPLLRIEAALVPKMLTPGVAGHIKTFANAVRGILGRQVIVSVASADAAMYQPKVATKLGCDASWPYDLGHMTNAERRLALLGTVS